MAAERSHATLRPLKASDAPVITDYHERCWHSAFASLVSADVMQFISQRRREPRIQGWLDRLEPESGFITVVAVDDSDTAIGHVMVADNEIVHLFIDPDHHGRGLGRQLLAQGEELLAAAGHTEIELHTIVGNTPAIGLYEACRWVVTTETITEELPNGSSYVEHVLRKTLGPVVSEDQG